MTLRGLAREIEVSPAFLSDLEKNRRHTDKLDQLAAALHVPVDELRALDSRVPVDLKEWLGANPTVVSLLQELKGSGRPVPIDLLKAVIEANRK